MSRKGTTKIRVVEPDAIYGSRLLTKLINRSMFDGKKSVAKREIYEALETIEEKTGSDPLQVFNQAIENIKPTMEVRPKRIGGAAYQVPQPVRGIRRESLAIRWLVLAANSRANSEFHTYSAKLSTEIMDAAKGEGLAVKKRTDMERVAEANKAFSHFRW
ncbi:MAG: 30S ribosomal protein S7 [Candidatus Woesebacteria bacterium GW2011_GWA1_41_7]|uniref:Small ribosomal subunit protein uS7 n=1 Tax=Candidatus Woesebacteria bacterium GW2011_GWA1_41_7 TaxID=1618556 RepID=A0A0G0WWK0_9BACT|nr:MAG: 30S ribosomal protein S7 [Candidatus Woesebacteria bacterium GW2011_GWA1_41_7]